MKKFLIVDDSSYMRDVIKISINKFNVEIVGEASNGKKGVELYKKLMPDIVIMDFFMDEENGLEALGEIMNHNSNAVVIMVSSAAEQGPIAKEAISLGVKKIFRKPLDKTMFEYYIDELLCE